MKILNIDSFASTNRQISLGGVTYNVEEPTVQQFIDNMKAAEELEKQGAGQKSLSESFEDAVKVITQSIPTMPEDTVRKLKLPAMIAVMQFVRGDLDPTAAQAPAAEDDAAKKQI